MVLQSPTGPCHLTPCLSEVPLYSDPTTRMSEELTRRVWVRPEDKDEEGVHCDGTGARWCSVSCHPQDEVLSNASWTERVITIHQSTLREKVKRKGHGVQSGIVEREEVSKKGNAGKGRSRFPVSATSLLRFSPLDSPGDLRK